MALRCYPVVISFALLAGAAAHSAARAQTRALTAPEAFTSQVQARTDAAGSSTNIRIQIDRYTAEDDRKRMTDALLHGGYPAFVQTLRKSPAVGRVELADQQFTVRWAREQATPKGRAITVVTDTPVYFVGGGRLDAKPREGFELAVVQLTVDEFGTGAGTMAAAARVKPDGQGGVLLEDYADKPITLTFVRREMK